MGIVRNSSVALLFSMLALQGFAQSAEPTPASSPAGGAETHRVRAHRGVPCWRQAGMTADMVNQRWQIEDQQKVKIAQVCTEPSTSAEQKHDKIEQIHADTDRSIAHLIPTKELAAFNKCQADLDSRHPKPAGQKEVGPCGGVIPDSASTDIAAAPEHRHNNATPANR
jgi:hypothetical protein